MLPRVAYDGYEKLFIPDAISKWNSLNSNTEKLSKKFFKNTVYKKFQSIYFVVHVVDNLT